VTPLGRQRLLSVIADSDVRLIGSGHTHRYRSLLCGGLAMVWAPTIGQLNHIFQMSRGGLQRTGWVAYTFREDGVEWQLVQPPELPPVDITELSAQFGAMRFVPPELSSALMTPSRGESLPPSQKIAADNRKNLLSGEIHALAIGGRNGPVSNR
jgi:hypothetical protein